MWCNPPQRSRYQSQHVLTAGAQQGIHSTRALLFPIWDSFPHTEVLGGGNDIPPHLLPCPRQLLSAGCSFSPAHSQWLPSFWELLPSPLQCLSWKQAHRENILFYLRHVFKMMLLFQMNELVH